jgi:hypothetical protein
MSAVSAIFIFALLVCNCTGNFAGRLAGCLAFTAATLNAAFLQVCLIQCFNLLHEIFRPFLKVSFIITQIQSERKKFIRLSDF